MFVLPVEGGEDFGGGRGGLSKFVEDESASFYQLIFYLRAVKVGRLWGSGK